MTHPRLLLFPLADGGGEEERLGGALQTARALEAHLRVMHTALEPQALLPKDVAVPGSVLAELDEAFDRHATRDNARLRSLFAAICRDQGVVLTDDVSRDGPAAASWFEARGVRSALVARHGKLADWIVLSRPPGGRATASLQAALMDTGRPVMVLPRRLDSFSLDTVMIGWNGSPQSVRASTAALDLLPRARRVLVVTTRDVETRGPGVAEVAAHLAMHGVEPEVQILHGDSARAGSALLDKAAEESASLLVMGAYGSHKVLDLMLGGVTAHVLEHCPVPMLLAN